MGDSFTSFRRGKDVYVRTYAKQLEQINMLRITSDEDADSPLYLPIRSNRKKTGVISALAKESYIPTQGEAERIINSLNRGADLHLAGIKVLSYTEENAARYESIDYNPFIKDGSFLSERKLLLFTFKAETNKMWAHETMFFALSELQQYFYEYRCVGELSEKMA
jgi:hypothetical protein